MESQRQHRGDSSKTQPSFCYAHCATVAFYTLSLRSSVSAATMRFMNSADTTFPLCSWRFINVPSTLMLLSWRLNYAHDDCCCASAGYPIPTFIQDAIPPQARGELHLQVWGRLLSPSLDRRRDIPTPALRLLLPKLSELRPSRTPSKTPR